MEWRILENTPKGIRQPALKHVLPTRAVQILKSARQNTFRPWRFQRCRLLLQAELAVKDATSIFDIESQPIRGLEVAENLSTETSDLVNRDPSQEPVQKRSSAAKVFLPICLLVVAVVGFLYFYGGPGFLLYSLRKDAMEHPEYRLAPTPLPNLDFEITTGRAMSYFGYSFDVPWDEEFTETSRKSVRYVEFSNGIKLIVFDPASNTNDLDVINQEAKSKGLDAATIFGAEGAASNYALRSTILNTTLDDLRFRFSRPRMVGPAIALILKSVIVPEPTHALFAFKTEQVKGFQFGLPELDKRVSIHAYPDEDSHIELHVNAPKSERMLTQREISRIIGSMRRSTAR